MGVKNDVGGKVSLDSPFGGDQSDMRAGEIVAKGQLLPLKKGLCMKIFRLRLATRQTGGDRNDKLSK